MGMSETVSNAVERVKELEWFLLTEGYVRCDTAACNCGSWHDHRLYVGMNKFKDEVERLRALLKAYGQHHFTCFFVTKCGEGKCTCGLNDTLKELKP